jgi:hypothetical protein
MIVVLLQIYLSSCFLLMICKLTYNTFHMFSSLIVYVPLGGILSVLVLIPPLPLQRVLQLIVAMVY